MEIPVEDIKREQAVEEDDLQSPTQVYNIKEETASAAIVQPELEFDAQDFVKVELAEGQEYDGYQPDMR
jgi:hypothetical protein